MPSTSIALTGAWTKISQDRAAASYPDQLEFGSGGLYIGRMVSGALSRWDAGTWRLLESGTVKMSTARNGEILYQVETVGDVIAFRDPQGCEVRYRRETV